MKTYLVFKLWDGEFIMLINVKMPTIVGIFIFMSMINVKLSLGWHETSFITSEPDSMCLYTFRG